MREMKDSGLKWLGYIPKNWNIERLQWHMYEINVKNNPIRTTQVLSLTNKKGVIPYEEKGAQGNISKENYSEYHLAYKDTIVANSMNILIGSVAYSKYYGCVSPVYYVFKEKRNNNLNFINYIFQTSQFQKELRKYANGILEIRMRVSVDDILKRMVAFPSIREQKLIVDFLDEKCAKIDGITKDLQEQIDTLENYKKSVITEAVTKGLKPNVEMTDTGIKWIPVIPSHWKTKKGKYFFAARFSKGNKITLQLLSPTQKYGVIPQEMYELLSTQVTVKINEKTNLMSFKTIHNGDYCISLRSFEGGFEYCKYEGVVSPAYTVLYPTEALFRAFYKYLFKINTFIYEMNSYSLSLRDGKPISFDDFGNTYLPVPPIQEQKEIADYLDIKCAEIDEIIKNKKEQVEIIEEYKKSLIYEYVTGKKEVKNA